MDDDLLQLIAAFMQQLEQSYDELDDREALQVAEFLQSIMQFIEEEQLPQEPPQEPPGPGMQPIPQGAELLWILSGEDPNRFVNYLRTYPGEGLQDLVNNPAHLATVIAHLQQLRPVQEPGVGEGGIPNTEFPSSNVSGMQYDPKTGKLLVRFHGNKGEPVYQYDGVPPQIFQLLQHGNAFAQTKGKNKWGEWWPMKNPSIGAALNQWIKRAGYPYQRIR
jgi:hypothetical protein